MKTFVVIGLGRFGTAVAKELCRLGNEVLAVDIDEENVQRISNDVTHAVVADAKEESVLRSLGVRNFDCAIVSIASDIQDSVLVTLILKELGVKTVISKAQNRLHYKVLDKIGADRIIFPELEMGEKLAQSLSSKNIIDFIELSNDYSIAEISTPKGWVGKNLSEIDVRGQYGLNVIAIKNGNGKDVCITPGAHRIINERDVLVVIGSNESIGDISYI